MLRIDLFAARNTLARGDRKKANRLLLKVLAGDPENGEAWYLLSLTQDEPAKRVYCENQARTYGYSVPISGQSVSAKQDRTVPRQADQYSSTRPNISPSQRMPNTLSPAPAPIGDLKGRQGVRKPEAPRTGSDRRSSDEEIAKPAWRLWWERLRKSVGKIGAIIALVAAVIGAIAVFDPFRHQLQQWGIISNVSPERPGETLIIIAPFFRPESNPDDEPHRDILGAIRQALNDLGLKNVRAEVVEGADLRADDRAGAEALGKRHHASMVIWGDYNRSHVTVNYLNLRKPDFTAANVTIKEEMRTELVNPRDYHSFITKDLPDQMAFLSLFAVGQSAFINESYSDAIRIIEKAVASLKLESNPPEGSENAFFLLGFMYDLKEDWEKAVNTYI